MVCNRHCRTTGVKTFNQRLLFFISIVGLATLGVLTYELLKVGIQTWLGPAAQFIYSSAVTAVLLALVFYILVIRKD